MANLNETHGYSEECSKVTNTYSLFSCSPSGGLILLLCCSCHMVMLEILKITHKRFCNSVLCLDSTVISERSFLVKYSVTSSDFHDTDTDIMTLTSWHTTLRHTHNLPPVLFTSQCEWENSKKSKISYLMAIALLVSQFFLLITFTRLHIGVLSQLLCSRNCLYPCIPLTSDDIGTPLPCLPNP